MADQNKRVVVQQHTRQPPAKVTRTPTKVTVRETASRTTTYDYKKK